MTTTSTRRRLSPEDRRAQLVAVGAEVFTALGYQGTSLEHIANAAGVTRPLLYRYFRDKDELYLELLRGARAELDASLVAAVSRQDDAEAQLRAGMRAYFAFVRDRGGQWDLLFGRGHAVAGPVAAEATRLRFETATNIAALVGAAVPDLSERAAAAYAHAISGAGEQLAAWWRSEPDLTLDEVVDFHFEVMWGGLERRARLGS